MEKLTPKYCIGLARRRDFTALLKSLSSSVFRRWLRLMLPALASSFIGLILARTGLAHKLYSDWDNLTPPGSPESERHIVEAQLPDPGEATLQNWIEDCIVMADPFRLGMFQFPKFNFPLWTMQVEYTGSMIVFIIVLGIAFARPAYRFAVPSMLVAFCILTGKWQWTLFISGVLLADLSYGASLQTGSLLDTGVDDVTEKTIPPSSSSLHQKILFYLPDSAAFLVACYIGTYPEYDPETSPGYRLLSKLIPPTWGFFEGYFYPVLGAILIVSALQHGKFLQNIFTTRIAQYLGDISLSMYMLHTQVELSLGNWLVPKCLSFTSGFGALNFVLGMSSKFIHQLGFKLHLCCNVIYLLILCSGAIVLCDRDNMGSGRFLVRLNSSQSDLPHSSPIRGVKHVVGV